MEITYDGPLLVCKSNSSLVTSDYHIPQHSWNMIEKAAEQNCRDLIIGADFFNQDSMSEYQRKQSGCDWVTERACARMIWNFLLSQFENVILMFGNHEKRLSKKTSYVFGIRELIDLTVSEKDRDRITLTDMDHIVLWDGERWWRICHSLEYSRNECSKPEKMGAKYGMNIIQGHSHIGAKKVVYRGFQEFYFIESGCMLDMEKVEYEQYNTSTFTNWANIMVKLKNGYVDVISDDKIALYEANYKIDSNGKWGYEKTRWERMR